MTVMRNGLVWLRALSLRAKLTVTVLAAAVAVLGSSTYLSFRFWQQESLAASERQALLAASATRAAVEVSLRAGRIEVARRNLRRLLDGGGVAEARIWTRDHTVFLSLDPREEGQSAENLWIPGPDELNREGVVRPMDGEGAVRAYIPVSIPAAAVLEVVVIEAGARGAMRRGAYLGIGLTIVSVLVVALLVLTMFEREVVAPVRRVEHLLPSERLTPGADQFDGIEQSVLRLVEREKKVQALAADQDRQLTEQDGLARVGGLAAEMAHEFKRPLASIRTAVEVLDHEHGLDEGGRVLLEAAHHQVEKLSETMEDLLSLARPVERTHERVDLHDVLDDALLQLAGFSGAGQVSIQRRYGRGLFVRGEAHRLTQAFLNVLSNAVEAMPNGGHLLVDAEASESEVTVSIKDTGPGLTAEEAERVLVPFYSTKPEGTGLGLSLVTRIVEAHQGTLGLSGDETGALVLIRLPHDPAPSQAEAIGRVL